MQILTSNAGGPGEQIPLLTSQGEVFNATLAAGSSVAGSTPLSSVLFVDGASTATGTPNGSIGNPFLTLQAAVDASVNNGTIYVCWTEAGYLEAVNYGSNALQIIGIGIGQNEGPIGTVAVTSFIGATALALQNIQTGQIETTSNQLDLVDCNIEGTGSGISCSNLVASARLTAAIAKPISCTGGAKLHNYSVSGSFNGVEYVASSDVPPELDGNVQQGVITCTGGVVLQGLVLLATISGDTVQINDCNINAAITITATSSDSSAPIMTVENTSLGDPSLVVHFVAAVESTILDLDPFTKQFLKNADLTTWSTIRVLGALAQEQISVTVPGVAAGDVGYVNVTAVAELAGCIVGDVVVANPTADLVAAGAGGGYINCRVSATNTIRLAFVGPLAGGASPFNFCRLSRAPLP